MPVPLLFENTVHLVLTILVLFDSSCCSTTFASKGQDHIIEVHFATKGNVIVEKFFPGPDISCCNDIGETLGVVTVGVWIIGLVHFATVGVGDARFEVNTLYVVPQKMLMARYQIHRLMDS
jgi:hypothetical protein